MTRRTLTWRTFNWKNGLFIIGYHLALLIGLPFYFYYSPPGPGMIIASVILLFVTELGIGGAYHRFYAHRCYALSKPAEFMLLIMSTLATQGSVLQWSSDHRMHHSYVDTDKDPYCIGKGFWYAHVLWLFEPDKSIDKERNLDLWDNPLVVFQHRYYGLLCTGGNFLVALLLGWALNDYLGAFVLTWWTRLLVSHHLTWFVNSLAHTWGERTYSKEHSAVDNYILAFLTVGEGYHNYHHTFASDYRNGFRWYHFDPTKWMIWTLSRLGLAHDLKRFDIYRIRKRLLGEDCRLLLNTLKLQAHARTAELEQRVIQLSDHIRTKLTRIGQLAEELRKFDGRSGAREALEATKRELKDLQKSLRHDWKHWSRVCTLVLKPQAA